MRHWYLLARELVAPRPSAAVTESTSMTFVEGGGPSPLGTLSPSDRRRMLWLGMVELTPLFGTSLIGVGLDTAISPGGWIAMGCIMSVGCCRLLRHRTPATVIHVTEETHEFHPGTKQE
jgi:hypothetical protein